jgi:hypothetical protein
MGRGGVPIAVYGGGSARPHWGGCSAGSEESAAGQAETGGD